MTAADPSYSRRWLILTVVGVAQVMVVLDTTVVNIALPSTQRALHFSNGDRQWVVTAYALAWTSSTCASSMLDTTTRYHSRSSYRRSRTCVGRASSI
jgi:MFS family permease